jgi:hypothetical protein
LLKKINKQTTDIFPGSDAGFQGPSKKHMGFPGFPPSYDSTLKF